MAGLGRALAGESLFMVTYACEAEGGSVVFTPEAPGRVLEFQLQANQSMICQKDTFLCAEQSVQMKIHFRKQLGAGLLAVRASFFRKSLDQAWSSWPFQVKLKSAHSELARNY